MHCDTFEQDNYSTVGGDGECRIGEVRAGTTSPMPDHKGFYATVTIRDPPTHTSSLRVKSDCECFPIPNRNQPKTSTVQKLPTLSCVH